MHYPFTKEQNEIRKTIINFARKELNPGIEERDRTSTFPKNLWDQCAMMRIIALFFPEKFGGEGFDFLSGISAFHALGYACKDTGLVLSLVSQVICGITILLFGDQEQLSQYLPDLISGKLIYCQGITEPGSGSDAYSMRTTALKKDSGYVLNGTKTMISNGPIADRALVYAVTDPEKKTLAKLSCFHIPTNTPGFHLGNPIEKMGLRTMYNGELVFIDCFVPSESLLGHEGQGAMLFSEVVEWERTLTSAFLLGQLERVCEESVRYSQEREAFGKPISDYQAVSHKIAKMKMNSELGKLALYSAAELKNQRKHAALETSIAKLFISESLKQACLDSVQIHGGYGYMSEYEVERELRDSIASTIYSGTTEMQLNTIAYLAGL